MTIVSLDKDVTITNELGKGIVSMQSLRYKDLEKAINNETEIEVTYCFGTAKRRVSLLKKLGFDLKHTIFYNDDAPYGAIKQVWARA
jgi:hypothetical protein